MGRTLGDVIYLEKNGSLAFKVSEGCDMTDYCTGMGKIRCLNVLLVAPTIGIIRDMGTGIEDSLKRGNLCH